jgi:hypothetical protein
VFTGASFERCSGIVWSSWQYGLSERRLLVRL